MPVRQASLNKFVIGGLVALSKYTLPLNLGRNALNQLTSLWNSCESLIRPVAGASLRVAIILFTNSLAGRTHLCTYNNDPTNDCNDFLSVCLVAENDRHLLVTCSIFSSGIDMIPVSTFTLMPKQGMPFCGLNNFPWLMTYPRSMINCLRNLKASHATLGGSQPIKSLI